MDKFHKSVNRLVVMSHISKDEQDNFIKEAKKQGFTAIAIPFMVRQLELNNRELMFKGRTIPETARPETFSMALDPT